MAVAYRPRIRTAVRYGRLACTRGPEASSSSRPSFPPPGARGLRIRKLDQHHRRDHAVHERADHRRERLRCVGHQCLVSSSQRRPVRGVGRYAPRPVLLGELQRRRGQRPGLVLDQRRTDRRQQRAVEPRHHRGRRRRAFNDRHDRAVVGGIQQLGRGQRHGVHVDCSEALCRRRGHGQQPRDQQRGGRPQRRRVRELALQGEQQQRGRHRPGVVVDRHGHAQAGADGEVHSSDGREWSRFVGGRYSGGGDGNQRYDQLRGAGRWRPPACDQRKRHGCDDDGWRARDDRCRRGSPSRHAHQPECHPAVRWRNLARGCHRQHERDPLHERRCSSCGIGRGQQVLPPPCRSACSWGRCPSAPRPRFGGR